MLEFKSSSFNIPVLILDSCDLTKIKTRINEKIAQAPEFFKYSPLIIDLKSSETTTLEISILIGLLKQLQFFPIGIQNGTSEQHEIATQIGIPILLTSPKKELHPSDHAIQANELAHHGTPIEISTMESKLMTRPIHSGQRVYSTGDLIILAPVSAGAEVIAEGNIHIYAPLRGRALAGVQGNTRSRIFCSNLQAELISIAGNYRIIDDLDHINGKYVQIFLQEQSLIIQEL